MELSSRFEPSDTAKQTLWLIFWIGLCFVAAFIGGLATDTGPGSWYNDLEKPDWNPPRWIFSPVWTTLYTLMGTAAWLVWKEAGGFLKAQTALGLFILQLVLNIAWSLIFFGLQRPDLAFIEITFLWIAIAVTMMAFTRYDYLATLLLVPYIAWVTFGGVLNFAIWWLN